MIHGGRVVPPHPCITVTHGVQEEKRKSTLGRARLAEQSTARLTEDGLGRLVCGRLSALSCSFVIEHVRPGCRVAEALLAASSLRLSEARAREPICDLLHCGVDLVLHAVGEAQHGVGHVIGDGVLRAVLHHMQLTHVAKLAHLRRESGGCSTTCSSLTWQNSPTCWAEQLSVAAALFSPAPLGCTRQRLCKRPRSLRWFGRFAVWAAWAV